jgi:hypothetical protein
VAARRYEALVSQRRADRERAEHGARMVSMARLAEESRQAEMRREIHRWKHGLSSRYTDYGEYDVDKERRAWEEERRRRQREEKEQRLADARRRRRDTGSSGVGSGSDSGSDSDSDSEDDDGYMGGPWGGWVMVDDAEGGDWEAAGASGAAVVAWLPADREAEVRRQHPSSSPAPAVPMLPS